MSISTDPQSLRKWLLAWIERTLELPSGRVEPDTHFRDLGINSIQAVDLTNDIESTFGIEVEPGELLQHPSVEKLTTLLQERTRA